MAAFLCALPMSPSLDAKCRIGHGPEQIASSFCKKQETHLNAQKLQEAQQYFIVRGWKVLGTPATDTGKGGNTGGFLCLHPPHHHIHALQHYDKEGNGWMAIGFQPDDLHIAIIQLYLRSGESLQSPLNADILANLFGFLDTLKAPFIIGGDWQNPPEDLAAMVVQSKFKAHLKTTDSATTLQGSQLDYLLISNELAGAFGTFLGNLTVL